MANIENNQNKQMRKSVHSINMKKLLHQSIASIIASEDDIQNSSKLLSITTNLEEGF